MKWITKKIDSTLFHIVFLMVVLGIFSLGFTLAQYGLPSGHDSYAHATYAKIFFEALRQEQFPVRWIEWIVGGHGQPLFNFYQSGFFYLAFLISLLQTSFVSGFKLTIIFCWYLGTFFIFLYSMRFGRLPAALASIVYAFSPYLMLDIFIRASFPEFMALSFVPAVFYFFDRLLTTAKLHFFFPFSLFLFILIFTHLPTLLIFSPVLVLYFIFLLTTKEAKKRGVVLSVLGGALGVGMAAFYLLPALTELSLVRIYVLSEGRFDFHKNFSSVNNIFTFIWGYNGGWWGREIKISILLGVLGWLIVGGGVVSLFFWKKIKTMRLGIIFWLVMIAMALYMQMKSSIWIWERISYLHFLQFPWRFFMIIPLSTAILSAILLSLIPTQKVRLRVVFLGAAICLLLYRPFFMPRSYYFAENFELPFEQWKKSSVTQMQAFIESGYNPKEVTKLPTDNRGRWQQPIGKVGITEKLINFDRMEFKTSSQEPFEFVINTHFFPDWRAMLDGEEIKITPTEEFYFIKLQIPSGSHDLKLKFNNTPIRSSANWISFAFLFLWIGGFGYYLRKRFLKNKLQF